MAKKRKPLPLPPLSLLDKLLYFVAILIGTAIPIGCLIGLFALRSRIALADPALLATAGNGNVYLLYSLVTPFYLLLVVPVLCPIIQLLQRKQPLFGNKRVKYGEFPYKNVYPLFSPNRPKQQRTPEEAQINLQDTRLLCSFLLAALLLGIVILCTLCSRTTLRQDYSIVSYNGFNHITHNYEKADIQALHIESYGLPGANHNFKWTFRLNIQMSDGRTYHLFPGSFHSASGDGISALSDILKFRNSVPQPVWVTGKENIEDIIYDSDYSAEEAALLYAIFGISQ